MTSCGWCGGDDALELPYYSAEYRGWMVVCMDSGKVAWLRSALVADDAAVAAE